MFLRQIFAIFANFCQILEMKYLRKIHRQSIHEIKSTQKEKKIFRFSKFAKLIFFHSRIVEIESIRTVKKITHKIFSP